MYLYVTEKNSGEKNKNDVIIDHYNTALEKIHITPGIPNPDYHLSSSNGKTAIQ